MFFALFLAAASLADWVPSRWNSSDPATLKLVRDTPINCLVLERNHWSATFAQAASDAGIATLGVVRPGAALTEIPQQAAAARLSGVLLEGDFDDAVLKPLRAALTDSKLTVIELAPRVKMALDSVAPVIGTYQGVWPGINEAQEGEAKAAPSGAPWIDTNTGFLRFLRAATRSTIWMGNVPPKNTTYPAARYLQVIGDAAILGARWILAFDPGFEQRLVSGDEKTLRDWSAIVTLLRYFEDHKEWRGYQPFTQMAMVQDIESGGLYSGSILDMISVKHTPVRPIPARQLADDRLQGATLAVNVDPTALNEEQKEILRRFTRGGGTLLTAPQQWKFPKQRPDQVTLDKDGIEKLDLMYREINNLTWRRNVGARLYNVSSMLSNLLAGPGSKPVVLHLVNYSDYPVESITAHVLGAFTKALLLEPGLPSRELKVHAAEDGTGIDIDKVTSLATLILE